MGNTGYKSFASLELYYTDDNSSAGVTKPNVNSDPDYIAPILDTATCAPSARFYNTVRTLDAIKNNCSSGYTGSTVTLTANANQFMSTVSQADANAQADAWLGVNAQVYANNSGQCELENPVTSYSWSFSEIQFEDNSNINCDISPSYPYTLYTLENSIYVGVILYTNTELTIPFNGTNLWSRANTTIHPGGVNYRINTEGLIIEESVCGIPVIYPFSIGHFTPEAANIDLSSPNSWYTHNSRLDINSVVYNDVNTEVINGANLWYRSDYTSICYQINESGVIISRAIF